MNLLEIGIILLATILAYPLGQLLADFLRPHFVNFLDRRDERRYNPKPRTRVGRRRSSRNRA